jgi:hypothetical protein
MAGRDDDGVTTMTIYLIDDSYLWVADEADAEWVEAYWEWREDTFDPDL